ncbi:MAG: histidine phosphatase family protein [Pelagibaca sp.]
MKRLILMRHAKSDWSASGDDHGRPLNGRGRDSAPAMGRWLADRDWLPDEVLCSTATRTRQTLTLLGLPDTRTRFERALYLAEPDEIIDTLRSASGDTVLLLGHNNGIAECAQQLVADWPDHPRFADYPTCATSLIRFDAADWGDIRKGTGQCEGFAIPREVIAAGPPG